MKGRPSPRWIAVAAVALVAAAIGAPRLEHAGRPASASASPVPVAVVADEAAAAPLEKRRFFSEEWMRGEGIPVYTGWSVDLETIALAPWPRLGARGAYVRLYGQQGLVNAYALEIAPGTHTVAEHHLFEEYLYVLRGHGRTRMWRDGSPPVDVEWGPNTLLSPPLNAWHETANTGDEPALLVGLTNAPPILDLYRDPSFVFDDPARFDDRWDGRADYFDRVPGPPDPRGGPQAREDSRRVNLIPDLLALGPLLSPWEAKRGMFASFTMCGNTLNPHVSAWPAGTYEAAHRHGPGASVLITQGEGFALMWPSSAGPRPWQDGHADSVVRLDFARGTLYAPPDDWYHTHFNVGGTEAVYVAVTPRGRRLHVQAFTGPGNDPQIERAEEAVSAGPPRLIAPAEEDPMMQRLLKEGVERYRSKTSAR